MSLSYLVLSVFEAMLEAMSEFKASFEKFLSGISPEWSSREREISLLCYLMLTLSSLCLSFSVEDSFILYSEV